MTKALREQGIGRTPSGRGRPAVTAAICGGVVLGMTGLSFAAVPLYRLFCQVTGFGGTTQRADRESDRTLDRMITVRFDANVQGLGWTFRPAQRQVRLRVGETARIAYLAESASDRETVGAATFNVTPELVGAYFNKISCFCFEEQPLAPGEKVELPVVFFVDPAIADDPALDYVDTITLSYTFFPARGGDGAPPAAALAAADKQ